MEANVSDIMKRLRAFTKASMFYSSKAAIPNAELAISASFTSMGTVLSLTAVMAATPNGSYGLRNVKKRKGYSVNAVV